MPKYKVEDFFGVNDLDRYTFDHSSIQHISASLYNLESNFYNLYPNDKNNGFFEIESNDTSYIDPNLILISRIHNYLSSLYTFSECVRRISKKHLQNEIKIWTDNANLPCTAIVSSCQILIGLRHLMQHGFTDILNISKFKDSKQRYTVILDINKYYSCENWNLRRSSNPENYTGYISGGNINISKQINKFHDKVRVLIAHIVKNSRYNNS